jgi:ribonuclease HI
MNLFDGAAPTPAAGQDQWFTAHCDGGSRGNPGPAAYGAVIEDPRGQVAARLSAFLGVQTNNYAEYAGLLAVLKWAVQNGVRCLRVVSDSELMVKQMNGAYKVASPGLRPLWEEARQLARKLDGFQMRHTLRAGNKEADWPMRLWTGAWGGWLAGRAVKALHRVRQPARRRAPVPLTQPGPQRDPPRRKRSGRSSTDTSKTGSSTF